VAAAAAVVAAAVAADGNYLKFKTYSMSQDISFNDFFAKVKTEFAKNGLAVPEDIELVELAHMECLAEGTPVEEFIQEMIAEQKR
jgi:hypothetical protein